MAIGDDALAAGMQVVPGTTLSKDIDTEINRTRDYIAQNAGTVRPIAKGGTGGATPAAARLALGAADDSAVVHRSGSADIRLEWVTRDGGRIEVIINGTYVGDLRFVGA